MSMCHLLGLGGSGSKALEAFLHLAAAGLGPQEAWVGLVDQDESNGNLARTKSTLSDYLALQKALRTPGGPNVLPPDTPLFKTRLRVPKIGQSWCPVGNSGAMTQSLLFGRDGRMKGSDGLVDLFDVLFSRDEQTLPFAGGYRGKPAVGASAIVAKSLDDNSLWPELASVIEQAQGGGGGRFFLIGSIFGGTGAASLPTLARLIRSQLPAFQDGKVEVGAMLLLPYFSYPPADVRADPTVAHAEAFLEQAQAALGYYADLIRQIQKQTESEFEREGTSGGRREKRVPRPLFDALYVVGYNPAVGFEKYSDAGETQCNPPLLPELLSGLAACDFFERGGRPEGALRLLAAQDQERVTWADLPDIGSKRGVGALGQYARFCHQMARVYGPYFNSDSRLSRQVADFPWYRFLVRKPLHGQAVPGTTMETLRRFSERAFRWLLTCSLSSSLPGQSVDLFRATAFQKETLEDDGLATVGNRLSPAELAAFGSLVAGGEWPDMARVYATLNDAWPAPEAQGIGVFIDALYQACRPVEENGSGPRSARRRPARNGAPAS